MTTILSKACSLTLRQNEFPEPKRSYDSIILHYDEPPFILTGGLKRSAQILSSVK